jgi:hypothetical protein
VLTGIVDIDHLRAAPGWWQFVTEQRDRLSEVRDKCLGIDAKIEVYILHSKEVRKKRFRQPAARTSRSTSGIAPKRAIQEVVVKRVPPWLEARGVASGEVRLAIICDVLV